MKTPTLHIGTSGYIYEHWQGTFYPDDLPQGDWFDFYANHFDTVEINNTFYNLPEADTFKDWAKRAPEDFRYAVKASRYLTHMKKLKDPKNPWKKFWQRVQHLSDHLGPILFQLPPKWNCNPDRLEAFLGILPDNLIAAFEFRDPSWHCKEIFTLLEQAGCALCVHDMEGCAVPRQASGDLLYARFHGSEDAYQGRYGRNRLQPWARWLRENGPDSGRDLYAYFNNDQKGYAVKDALALREKLSD